MAKIFIISSCTLVFLLGGFFLVKKSVPEEKTGTTGRYIKAIYSAPTTLDPIQMNDTASLAVSNLIYNGLLTFTPNLELRGAIAESWSTSRDGKTLSFKLRSNAKFQNGDAITAEDVVASLERAVGPGSRVYSYYDCIKGAEAFHQGKAKTVAGLKAKGKTIVEIELLYPFPPFLSVLAGATAKILPQAAKQKDFFKNPIGSGPFLFVKTEERSSQKEILLRRFEEYYAEKPKVEEILLRILDEKDAIAEAREGRVHDLANYPLTGQESVFDGGQEISTPIAATWIIGLNSRIAPFNDLNIRQAFRDAVNTKEFREKFFPDALPAHGYIPPGLPGYQRTHLGANLKKNKSASHELIRIAIPKELARHEEMKVFFEKSLRSQGWNVEVVPIAWTELMEGYSNKNLQAFLVSMNMDYPDTEFLVRNFESTNPDNFSGIRDDKVDSLIHKARATQDRVRRQAVYSDLVNLLYQSAVTVNLFHPRGHYWVSSCVKGFQPNILADVYIDYRSVSLGKNCTTPAVAKL